MHPSSDSYVLPSVGPVPQTRFSPASVLAWTLFLLPTLGVPSELVLQDTLKSAVLAFGVLAAALLFFWQQRQRTAPLRWHGLLWLPLALMAYALGSMAWSHTYLAGVEAIRWFLLSLLLWLGLNTLNRDTLPTLLWGVHAGAVGASVWVALQFWFDLGLFPQAAPPGSTFANRNFFAEYAVAALPFSVWLLASLKSSRWLVWVALSVTFDLVAILMTGTRSALIALCVVMPLLILLLIKMRTQLAYPSWGHQRQVLVGLVLVLGVAILGNWPTANPNILREDKGSTALQRSFQRTTSMAQGTEYTEGSFSVRTTMWLATARMMLANPLTGVGAGAWEVDIPLYQRTYTTLETDYYAHNETLQLLSEYGLVVGGLCLAFLLAYLIKAAAATWQASGAALQEAPLRAVTLTSVLALLIVSNAGFPLHLAGGGMLLAVCLGLLGGSDARLGSQYGVVASKRFTLSGRAVSLVLIGLMCCLALATFITVQTVRAESKLIRAITLANAYARAERLGLPGAPEIKKQALQLAHEGIAIHPHYRKLSGEIAEPFAIRGDWQNAIWILESLAASRPHVAALWTGLANGYAAIGEHNRAEQAFLQLQRLKPEALSTATLHATLLMQAGHGPQAAALLDQQFDTHAYDLEMTQAGYAIGYKTGNWPLAIRSLELRNRMWPEQAADGFFRLGKLYAEPQVHDTAKALQAFKAGLAAVPAEQRSNYIGQVPSPFREQM